MIEQLPQLLAAVNGLFAKVKAKIDTKLDKTGNAASASKLAAAFNLMVSGDATGSASTNGLNDLAVAVTLKDIAGLPAGTTVGNSSTVATLVVDAKGRVVQIQGIAIVSGTTAVKGLVQLSSATNSTSEALAATPAAVKAAFDLANAALPAAQKGANSGVAELDAGGLLPAARLPASGATAGTFTKVVINAKGVVTSGSLLVAGDIPDLDVAKLTTGVLSVARGGTGGKTMANRNIFISTADPSGGADGDIWLKYTP